MWALLRVTIRHSPSATAHAITSPCSTPTLLQPPTGWSAWWKLRTDPEAAAWGSRQLCDHDPSVLDGTGYCCHLSGTAWRARHGQRQEPRDLRAREIFAPCAAAALYRRSVLQQLGGFDEHYFCYMEDVDLGFRLRLLGHSARYVPQAVVRHVGSATSGGQRSAFALFYGHRNMVWTFVKNMPLPLLLLLLPLQCHGEFGRDFLVCAARPARPSAACKSTRFAWFALRVAPACQRSAFDDDGPSLARMDKNWWPRP